ncbi:MAG: PAS domain-containing protein [Bauldia sp.]|nr:PAS domain-containing protein [Bauldia sp.]
MIETEESDHIALIPYDTSGPGQPPQMRYWSATHTPVFDADGRFHLILQHTEDVTELQRLRSATRRDNMSESSVLRRAAEVQAANSLLASEVDLVRSLFRQAPGFMALLAGPDHVFQLANAAYEDLVGRHDLIGLRLAEALPEVVGQGFVELLDQVMRTGEPFIGRGVLVQLAPTPGDPPVDHFLDFIYQPYRDASGEVVGVFVQGHDITEQKKAEQDVFRQTEILRLAQEAGGFGTFEWDLATGLLTASPAFRRLYGFDGVEEIPVRAFQERVHPDDAAKLATSPGQTLEEALQYAEYRVRQPSGDYIWVGRQGTVLNDAQGRPSRVVGAVHDITRRKQFEAQLETLARESTHRVKNLLAIVQAIVSQTLRKASDIDSASLAIRQRLMAIAATQTALTNGTVAESDLDTLVRSALELHTQTPGRVRIAGPNVVIDGKTALGLTLVLHELGTNAVKYGALSREGGHVDIAWTIEAGGRHADLSWRESGGPRVTAPARQGFGSHLIARSLPPVDGVEATIDYAPTGLVFRVRLAVGGAEEGSPPAQ